MANCYFLSCHRSRSHVADLMRYLYRPDHLYVVHCDPKAPADLTSLVADLGARLPNVAVLPARDFSWAGYSMVETALGALRVALSSPNEWSHFFWLSEQHLPLWGQDAPCWVLDPAVSYCDALPVSRMDPAGQADVGHRFSLRFRELPGVGAFGTGPAGADPALLGRLHHGSNWFALSRTAAAAILSAAGSVEPLFRETVHADELMLQTLLAESGLPVRPWNPTFIAWPHLGGSADMICTETNVAVARQEGRLFIRKRPDRLWPGLAANLDAQAGLPDGWADSALELPVRQDADVAPLARALLQAAAADGRVTRQRCYHDEAHNHLPALYLALYPPAAPRGLRLCVLSQDLSTFKLLIALTPGHGDWLQAEAVGPHAAHSLRARVYDLFMEREVVIADEPDAGFVTLPADGTVDTLLGMLRRYLGHLDRVREELTAELPAA